MIRSGLSGLVYQVWSLIGPGLVGEQSGSSPACEERITDSHDSGTVFFSGVRLAESWI